MRWRRVGEAWRLWRAVLLRIDSASVRIYAADIAYHAVVAVVSLATLLLVIGDRLGIDFIDNQLQRLPDDLESAAAFQSQRVDRLSDSNVALLGIAGLVIAGWGLASGFAAVYDALNGIYGTHRYRSFFARYARALLLAIACTFGLTLALIPLALDASIEGQVFSAIGLDVVGDVFAFIIELLLLSVGGAVAFALVIRYGSAARPSWTECVTAASVTVAGWVPLTLGMWIAVEYLGAYRGYGALAIFVASMLYAYYTCYVLLTSALFAAPMTVLIRRWRGDPAEPAD
jgi:uncharacterized BrkB/YihY/UPF0761 family membrane protein